MKKLSVRVAIAALACVLAATGLAVPAWAATTGVITGRLVDASGQPAAGAEVAAAAPESWESEWVNVVTGDDGRYRLNVPPGEYQLQFHPWRGGTQWAPQKRLRTEGAMFTVAAGAETVVDETLLPSGSIAGRLVDAAGQPMSQVMVTAKDGEVVGNRTFTDEDGRYSMDVVFVGQYKLSFDLPNNLTVWAHNAVSEAAAQAFTVTAGAVTVVDETLAAGSIAGRFAAAGGSGLAKVEVTVILSDSNQLSTRTDKSGAYRIDNVPAGEGYLVRFSGWGADRVQYAFGKADAAQADRVTVTNGKTTEVNDSPMAGGELRVRPTDRASGVAVSGFCVGMFGPLDDWTSKCTEGDELVFSDLNPGAYRGNLRSDDDSLYLPEEFTATVNGGESTTVGVKATLGGAITTVVTDAQTGQPVAGVWVTEHTMTRGSLGEGSGNSTDAQGRVRVGPVVPGTYTLFAQTRHGSPYGHQWVGASGGTGDQREALKITVSAGQAVAGPNIRLDRAGTVTGVVTSAATGKPVTGGELSYTAWSFAIGTSRAEDIDANGRYTLTGLGPYDWPLYVAANDVAPQWSGGVGSRFKATKISVRAGETTTYSPALVTGSLLRGTMTPAAGGDIRFARLIAFNGTTGDPIAVATTGADGVYRMRVAGSQAVKLAYDWSSSDDDSHYGWYDGASRFEDAKTVSIPGKGQKVLDVTLR